MSSISTQVWLEEVAHTCATTLTRLSKKAEITKEVTDGDQVMSEICMGYLFLLHRANEEGLLEAVEHIGKTLDITIH